MNLYESLVLRSMREEGFREKLRKDPRGVLSAEGVDVPASVNVEVHEVPADTVTLVVSTDGQEPEAVHALADIQMEQEVSPPPAGTERDWLRDSLGLEVDHSGPIRLLWNTANTWNIAIPCAGGELGVLELDAVAGGTGGFVDANDDEAEDSDESEADAEGNVRYSPGLKENSTRKRIQLVTARNRVIVRKLSPGRYTARYRPSHPGPGGGIVQSKYSPKGPMTIV